MKLYRIIILALCTYALISCGGADERKAAYLEKAKSSIKLGDLEKARIELKNVLQIDPKYSEGFFQLGMVYEKQNEYRKAYTSYLKVEELDPDNLENQAKLGRIYLLLANDIEKAQSKIDLILTKDPNNIHGLLLKASMSDKTGDTKEAIAIVNGVVGSDPGNSEAAAFLAALYIKEDKVTDAIHILDKALESNQDDMRLNKLLAAALMKNKNHERAEELFKKFLERNSDVSSSYNNLAIFYHQSGKKAKAEAVLRESIENDPDDVERITTLIKYIAETKGNDEAIQELYGFVEKKNGLGKLRIALAQMLMITGEKQKAIEIYNKAIVDFSEEVTGVRARIQLAAIFIINKEFEKAADIVEEAIAISPNDPSVNFLRAKLAVRNKDYERAIISLRIVTKETPENIDAFILLAKVFRQEENEEQVRSTLNSAYDNNKTNADALLRLAQYYIVRDIDTAEKIIDDFIRLKPNDYEGLSIKGAILNKKKDYSEAYKIAETLMEGYPDKPNGYLNAFPYYMQQGDNKNLVAVLEKGYLNAKDNRKILTLLTTAQVIDKQYETAEHRLKSEIKASPDDADLKMLLSKVYIDSNNYNSAEKILKTIIIDNSEYEQSYLLLSKIYQKNSDYSSAIEILKQGKNSVPSSYEIPMRLASFYEVDNKHIAALEEYRGLYEIYPNSYVVINNLASLISEYKDNDKDDLLFANELIEKLKNSKDMNAAYLDTIGWVHYKLNDYGNAIRYLSQAVESMPKAKLFNYHLGMAYKMSGDTIQAKLYLEKTLEGNKPFKYEDIVKAALKNI